MEPNNSRMGTIGMTIFTFAILLSVRDLLRHKPLVSGDSSRNTDEASSTEEDVTSERDSESTSNNFEDDFAEVSDVEENEPIEVRDTTDFAKTNAKNLKNRFQSSSLTFLYCVSHGYKEAFGEFSRIIHEKYPNLDIKGSHYPPSFAKAIVAQISAILKIIIIAGVVSSRSPFPWLGMETPAVYTWATENKLTACILIFLFGSTLETSMISTGAFEIYLNDQPVWSKLESGRIPSPGELLQIIDSHFEMDGGKSETFTLNSLNQ